MAETPTVETRSKMRTLIRQNSEKIGAFAEEVVLPKSRRSLHRMHSIAQGQSRRSLHRMYSVAQGQTFTQDAICMPEVYVRRSNSHAMEPTQNNYYAMESIRTPECVQLQDDDNLFVHPKLQEVVIGNHVNIRTEEVELDGNNRLNIQTDTMQEAPVQKLHFPTFMIALSFIQVLLMAFMSHFNSSPILFFGYDPHRRYQIWRFFTIMFVHTRISHLCSNILLQLILGVLLEIVHGWLRIAVIYFASVIGGSLFITLFNPNNYGVGASPGVYGLLFSHLSTIILYWNEMDKKFLRLSMLLFYIIVDIGINVGLAPDDLDINYVGHIGGGVTGFLVSILVLKSSDGLDEKHWKKKMQIVCVVILAILVAFAIFVNVFAWDYYRPTEWNKNYSDTYDKFVYERAIYSPENSTAREYCRQFTTCKLRLNKFNVNSTSPGVLPLD